MPAKRWILPPPAPDDCARLGRLLGVPPVIAHLLACRGFGTEDAARRFLEPRLEHLHDPFLLPAIREAVDRLAVAVRAGEKILVHGDYDVDGVCAAALLTRVLRKLGANVEHFVPHRRVEGYDLQVDTVKRAAKNGVRLILTADCGIVAFDAARTAAEEGVDLIVTDHHEPDPGGRLPQAVAVVNPKRPESEYPFPDLCGTAVAYKLCMALLIHMEIPVAAFRTGFLDLVALATAADCMPLRDENRVFLKYGLEALRKTNKHGLKALMKVAALQPEAVKARSLGFALGPRINAIGRLDAASHALSLLLTGDEAEADQLAERLDGANRERQQEQERILQDALRQAERFNDDRILVLASPKWHAGVIGIVASKLAESLCRPTIMIAIDEESGTARGSCRSVEEFDIFEAVSACRELLLNCGGHQGAAGFGMQAANVDAFREAVVKIGAEGLSEEVLQPSLRVDAELAPEHLRVDLARALSVLEPYGHGNHEPLFMTRGLRVLEQRRLPNKAGQGPDHLKVILEVPNARRGVDALFWRSWARAGECPPESRVDLLYTLELNQYNGYSNLQLKLQDLRPAVAD